MAMELRLVMVRQKAPVDIMITKYARLMVLVQVRVIAVMKVK